MNTSRTILVGLCFLAIGLRTKAQCPADFQDLGQVIATVTPGRYQQVQVTRELSLPEGIQIDESYHQQVIEAASDGGASDMRAVQIPPGFHLSHREGGRRRMVVRFKPGVEANTGKRQRCWPLDLPRLICMQTPVDTQSGRLTSN